MSGQIPSNLPPIHGEEILGPGPYAPLRIRYYTERTGQVVLEIAGELDLSNSAESRSFLAEIIDRGYIDLIFRLDETIFIDSTGLGVLAGAVNRVSARHGTVYFACDDKRILMMFQTTGTARSVNIFRSVESAVASFERQDADDPSDMDVDEDGVMAGHWIPVRLYLSKDKNHAKVEAALLDLLDSSDLEIYYEFPALRGSYWREWGARFKRRELSPDQIDERFAQLEQALKVRLLDDPQAKVNEVQAKAVAELIKSLAGTDDAVIALGSVLLLKVKGQIFVRNLSATELIDFERDGSVFRNPKRAFAKLQEIAAARERQSMAEPLASHAPDDDHLFRGLNPQTGTVHLAVLVSVDGHKEFLAQCKKTVKHLLETDLPVSCDYCIRAARR